MNRLIDFFSKDPIITDIFTRECMINIWLVSQGKRRACMIESGHIYFNTNILQQCIDFAEENNCVYFLDPIGTKEYPRYIFVNRTDRNSISMDIQDDRDLGYLLGMTYLNDDWFDCTKERTNFLINIKFKNSKSECNVYTEMTREPDKTRIDIEEKVKQWNSVRFPHVFGNPVFYYEESIFKPKKQKP